MTRNQYVSKYGYMSWLGRQKLNDQVCNKLSGFNVQLTNKQVNALSEMIEDHIRRIN